LPDDESELSFIDGYQLASSSASKVSARATTREKLVDQSFRLWGREGQAFEDHFCAPSSVPPVIS
jgi:hypothetical protein